MRLVSRRFQISLENVLNALWKPLSFLYVMWFWLNKNKQTQLFGNVFVQMCTITAKKNLTMLQVDDSAILLTCFSEQAASLSSQMETVLA